MDGHEKKQSKMWEKVKALFNRSGSNVPGSAKRRNHMREFGKAILEIVLVCLGVAAISVVIGPFGLALCGFAIRVGVLTMIGLGVVFWALQRSIGFMLNRIWPTELAAI
jgi:hypothetical protein